VKRLPHEGQEEAPRSTSLPQFSQKYLGFIAIAAPVIDLDCQPTWSCLYCLGMQTRKECEWKLSS
jgi:hypothetical protein